MRIGVRGLGFMGSTQKLALLMLESRRRNGEKIVFNLFNLFNL